MSEFVSTVPITDNDQEKLQRRITAQYGIMKKARARIETAKPADEAEEKSNAKEVEAHMNRLLDHWPDGKPRDIDYKPVAQEAEEKAREMREVLDKELTVQ